MIKIPKIIYGQGEGLKEGILIYNDVTPIIGKIVFYDSYMEMMQELNLREPVAYAILLTHSIVVTYAGILGRGNRIDPTQIDHVKQVMRELADWYYQNRIFPHLPRFKRYLL